MLQMVMSHALWMAMISGIPIVRARAAHPGASCDASATPDAVQQVAANGQERVSDSIFQIDSLDQAIAHRVAPGCPVKRQAKQAATDDH
jgi:hypothetical protein